MMSEIQKLLAASDKNKDYQIQAILKN